MKKLTTVGIVCEFNPFHYGHKYIIEYAKKTLNADAVVCVMSGSFVQRGDVAVFDKWSRAKYAVLGGADLVIELPAFYALQSAQKFAYGAVKLLDDLKCIDYIAFGSENANINNLNAASDILLNEPQLFKDTIKKELNKGQGYPYAIDTALKQCLPQNINLMPNDRLAINYITAIKQLNSNIKPFAVKRENEYHCRVASNGFASATAVRNIIKTGDDTTKYAPDYTNECIYDLNNIESLVLGFFRTVDKSTLKNITGFENGFENSVVKAAKKSCTLNEFFDILTSKRYTRHRVRRAVLCAVLGITDNFVADYIRPLAFNKKGTELLSEIKSCSDLTIVSKLADFNPDKKSMLNIDILATDISALCANDKNFRFAGKDYIISPKLLTSEF